MIFHSYVNVYQRVNPFEMPMSLIFEGQVRNCDDYPRVNVENRKLLFGWEDHLQMAGFPHLIMLVYRRA
jgi:hypothetical protein